MRVDRISCRNSSVRYSLLTSRLVVVAVIVAVSVNDPVTVAALVNGNDVVSVIDAVDDQGSMSLVSIATILSRSSMPRAYSSASINSSTCMTSRCEAHSIAEPLAIV